MPRIPVVAGNLFKLEIALPPLCLAVNFSGVIPIS
jgi:hypothetical protein